MKKDQHCFVISLAVKFVICYKQPSLLMSTLKICFSVETEKKNVVKHEKRRSISPYFVFGRS